MALMKIRFQQTRRVGNIVQCDQQNLIEKTYSSENKKSIFFIVKTIIDGLKHTEHSKLDFTLYIFKLHLKRKLKQFIILTMIEVGIIFGLFFKTGIFELIHSEDWAVLPFYCVLLLMVNSWFWFRVFYPRKKVITKFVDMAALELK